MTPEEYIDRRDKLVYSLDKAATRTAEFRLVMEGREKWPTAYRITIRGQGPKCILSPDVDQPPEYLAELIGNELKRRRDALRKELDDLDAAHFRRNDTE